MKILTLGDGFIANHLPYEQIRDEDGHPFRLTPNEEDVDYCLSKDKPDVIINCLGRTGRPNVDWCESHRAETYLANVTLPLMIAEWCEAHDVHMIQIGSGCIYFGPSPNMGYGMYCGPDPKYKGYTSTDHGWLETDFANPQSYYSKTKYACDLALGEMPNVTTLRIRMPLSEKDTPRNLINKLRGYKEVIDIPNSVTFMSDLIRCVDWAAHSSLGAGIFHVVNPQPLTAARIMQEFQKHVPNHKFEIIGERRLQDLVVAKRSNCILSGEKLLKEGFRMTPTEDELKYCMSHYIKNMNQEGLYVK
jgi:dTDP-4-dehydrorhamnose reductase